MQVEYFTITEVAEKLKVTPAAIRKWIAQGKIEVVYVGADRRITGDAITAFVKENTAARNAKRRKDSEADLRSLGFKARALVTQ